MTPPLAATDGSADALASQDVVYEKVESRASGADGCEP